MTISTLYAPSYIRRSTRRLADYVETHSDLMTDWRNRLEAAIAEWSVEFPSEAVLLDAVSRDAQGGLLL